MHKRCNERQIAGPVKALPDEEGSLDFSAPRHRQLITWVSLQLAPRAISIAWNCPANTQTVCPG